MVAAPLQEGDDGLREIILTLSKTDHAQLTADVAVLRPGLGNNTQAIVDAVHAQAEVKRSLEPSDPPAELPVEEEG
jgi:hypothetical protein